MNQHIADRVEIDFSIYNPVDPDFVRDPYPVFTRLLEEYPVAFHTGINGWLISPHDLAAEALRDQRLSTNLTDWANAPEQKPEAEWTLFDRLLAGSLSAVDRAEHLRLRRLTAPAFSRRVMDKIEVSIADAIVGIFDEIADPHEFNVASEIAVKVTVRAIARMVGVPPAASELFEHGLAWNMVRACSPMYPLDERERFAAAAVPGLQYILDTVAARRASGDPGDDFIGTLITSEDGGERLTDMQILNLIGTLLIAGADTAVDVHTVGIYALLTHPEQRALLRANPALSEGMILETLRWSGIGKFGGLPRFPLDDVTYGGQVLEKGSLVMPMFGPAWSDPAKWPDPRKYDITRDHKGNIIFGAGPHMCLGMSLVRVQARLMVEEFERRFGDTAELVGEIEYDPWHFNARRMTTLMVRTGA
jgi:cytochrome P450